MFNVGGPEFLVIVLVALVVLGPQQLPKAMRTFGNVMAEVRKVSSSFQAEMRNAMDTVTDTTGDEKPKSGTMSPATPAAGDGTGRTEVVARNDAEPQPEPEPQATVEPEGGADGDGPGGLPPVDPADRAAG